MRSGIASGSLTSGDQLPTVRQLAVDLTINPNTVMRAYRELELGGLIETHQGTGTFIANKKLEKNSAERDRQLAQMAGEFAARAGLGWNLQGLSDRAGINPNTISRFESGKDILLGKLRRLEEVFSEAGVEFIAENGGGAGVRLRKRRV